MTYPAQARKKNVKNPLTNPKAYDIIRAQRERTDPSNSPPVKKVQKLLKKVLDKPSQMCYNKNVKRNTPLTDKKFWVAT